nr:hypothetical protein GCM10025699_39380 [Microbacterium flavescens]
MAVARARVVNTGGSTPSVKARLRLSAKFYLVAMFFVIFDVEALYLYAWSTSIRERLGRLCGSRNFHFSATGWSGYLVRIGALDWTPARSRRTLVNPETDSPTNRHMQ